MICDGCSRYRGMRGDRVRCWNKLDMILTEIPVASLRRKKECPRKVVSRPSSPEPSTGGMDWRKRIKMEVSAK